MKYHNLNIKNKYNKLNLSLNLFSLLFLFTNFITISNETLDYSKSNLRYIKNDAFGYGEKLEYKIGYKFINAGTGSFIIGKDPITRYGRKAYDINFEVKSLASLEWIFKVRDRYSTILDVASIIPWEFEQHIREGNFRRDFKAKFDQIENKAFADNKTYNIPENTHDIVSAFYYVRTLNLKSMKKDSVIMLKNFFKDSTYNLGVKILGRETVKVEAGTFKTVVIQPLVQEGGLFKSDGKIVIWLTDDERKIPVKVGTKIAIGFVGAELTNYSGLRGPVEALVKEGDN